MVELTTKQGKAVVYDHLALMLGPEFRLKKSDEQFVRPFSAGSHVLFVGFWAYPPQFVFSVTPAVRIVAIEELYKKVFDVTIKNTNSVLTQLWRLDGIPRPEPNVPLPNSGSPYYWTFTDDESAHAAVEQLRPRIISRVLPFYEAIRTVRDAHKALNSDFLDTSNGRVCHGLIAAFLADQSSWRSIAARYQQELRSWPKLDQDKFGLAVTRLVALESGPH